MSDDRTCGACGKVLVRREGEGRAAFQKRKTCGRGCAQSLGAKTNANTSLQPISHDPCPVCGTPIERRPGENASNFKKRKACSKACADVLTGRGTSGLRVAEEKYCEICGDQIPYAGEELWRWRQRQRCGKSSCRSNHVKNPTPPLEQKTCIGCGATMLRGQQVVARFKAKKYCSYECSVRHKSVSLPEHKQCIICRAPMARRPKEGATHWRARVTCSKECRYKHIWTLNDVSIVPKADPAPKQCVVCGQWYGKNANESFVVFEAKKACSRECAGELVRQARSYDWQPKVCEFCGGAFEKRPDEEGKYYSKRKCCSPTCQYSLMIQTRLKGADPVNPYPREWNRQLKEQIRARDGFACRECGVIEEDRAHHVHHIDYVKDNLDPNNLITLCHSCHGKTCNSANKAYFVARYTAMMKGNQMAA